MGCFVDDQREYCIIEIRKYERYAYYKSVS